MKSLPIAPLRDGRAIFFDTNFFLRQEDQLPHVNFGPDDECWITETVERELIDKLGAVPKKVLGQEFKVLRFDDLYTIDRGVCPVFYNFYSYMYNPAVLDSENFMDEAINAMYKQGMELSTTEKAQYDELKRRSPRGTNKFEDGSEKTEEFKQLETATARALKKSRRSSKNQNQSFMNDCKSLALIAYRLFKFKQDVVLYTMDGDCIHLLFNLMDSISMQLALMFKLVSTMPEDEISDMVREIVATEAPVTTMLIDFEEFASERRNVLRGLFNDNAGESRCRITLKTWNYANMKYKADFWLSFDDEVADLLGQLQGNKWCHFNKNDTHLNFLRIQYDLVFDKSERLNVKCDVQRKTPTVRGHDLRVSPEVHDSVCLYRKADLNRELVSWSEFMPFHKDGSSD